MYFQFAFFFSASFLFRFFFCLNLFNTDIILVTETSFYDSIYDTYNELADYHLFQDHDHGSGNGIFVKSIVRKEAAPVEQSLMLTINLKANQTLPVGVIYHPPSSFMDFAEKMCQCLERLSCHNFEFKIIIGIPFVAHLGSTDNLQLSTSVDDLNIPIF